MLDAFASVGVTGFTMVKVSLAGREVKHENQPRPIGNLRRTVSQTLAKAEGEKCRVIIRPRGSRFRLVQLDDLDAAKVASVEPYAFLIVKTSPGNHQAWLAITDAPSDPEAVLELIRRLKTGTGADKSASGATIVAGCLNFKPRYAPGFPIVQVVAVSARRTTTFAALDTAGLLGTLPARPESLSPRRVEPGVGAGGRSWPDYQRALDRAPRKADGNPDRSNADWAWACVALNWDRGNGLRWSAAEIADELYRLSGKAQERGKEGGMAYCLVTVERASRAAWRSGKAD